MNEDIKNGVTQLAKGLKIEAKDIASKLAKVLSSIRESLDKNNDGKIDVEDIKDYSEAFLTMTKASLDNISTQLKSDNLTNEAKERLLSIITEFKASIEPIVDTTKEVTEDIKYKVKNINEEE